MDQPFSPPAAPPPEQDVRIVQTVTIERTDKQFKFGMLIGFLMMPFGIAATAYSIKEFTDNFGRLPQSFTELAQDQNAVYVSIAGVTVGFTIYSFERFLAWWNNG